MLSPRRLVRLFLCLVLVTGLLSGTLPGLPQATAQTFPSSATGVTPTLPQAARLNRSSVSNTQGMALEGAIDPQEYLVGPGDVFAIATGGAIPQQTEAVVSADGRLVVPEAGAFQVAGRPLATVVADVGAALQRRYRNVTTGVSLLEPRKFSVHVSGSVPAPGRYAVRAVARVEDALTEAMAETGTARGLAAYDRPIERERERRPALRNVLITRQDGTTDRVDLMRYFATGDVEANPYLRDGDAIHLPTFDPVREGVFVYGAVDRPAVYDVRPGDTAADVLGVASGRDLSRTHWDGARHAWHTGDSSYCHGGSARRSGHATTRTSRPSVCHRLRPWSRHRIRGRGCPLPWQLSDSGWRDHAHGVGGGRRRSSQ